MLRIWSTYKITNPGLLLLSILSFSRLLELLEKRRKRQRGHDTTRYNLGSTKEDTRKVGMTFRANFREKRMAALNLFEGKTYARLPTCSQSA